MKSIVVAAVAFILVCASTFGIYKYGYTRGHTSGVSDGRKNMINKDELSKLQVENASLQVRIDNLQNDFDLLKSASAKQASSPVYCSTYNYTYINSSSTTCY